MPLENKADRGGGGDDPGGVLPPAAGRAGGPSAARAGRSRGPARHRRTARRYRAREPADNVTRSLDLAAGNRGGAGSPWAVPDSEGYGRVGARPRPRLAFAPARRVDAAPRQSSADPPSGGEVDVRDGLRRAWRADLACGRTVAGDLLARAALRAARDERYRFSRACREAPPSGQLLRGQPRNRGARAV